MDKFFTSTEGFVRSRTLPASGSHRIYHRLFTRNGTLMAVENPNVQENLSFIEMSRFFRSRQIRVPEVLSVSQDASMYIQEDLGEVSLRDCLDDDLVLNRAVRDLVHIQFEGRDFDFSKCFSTKEFSGRVISYDLNYFKYCFLKLSSLEFDENALQDDFDSLSDALLLEPFDTFMYRDFQSRNVLVRDSLPWFIDFQGGFRGPFYYDICSFVFQASAHFPESTRAALLEAYYEELTLFRRVDRGVFDSRIRIFALFRCLQTLGAYGFRGLVEHKKYFTDSIPAGVENLIGLSCDAFPTIRSVAQGLAKIYLK